MSLRTIFVSIIALGALCGSSLFFAPTPLYAADCTVTSATFNPYGNKTLVATGDTKAKMPVTITILTENCAGKKLSVSVSPILRSLAANIAASFTTSIVGIANAGSVAYNCITTGCDIPEFNDLEFYVPEAASGEQEKLTIEALAGESYCSSAEILYVYDALDPDCGYRIVVDTPTDTFVSNSHNPTAKIPEGELTFDCDGACEWVGNNWFIVGGNGLNEEGNLVYVKHQSDTNTIDPNSPCFKDGQYDPECYELISDIPLKDEEGNQIKYITNAQLAEGGLALTFNSFYKLLIGLASLIAVIMVIVAVIKYWSTDNISTKQLMKGRLTNIALGILLLVGMVVILGTINPDLLRVEPEILALTVDVKENEDPEAAIDRIIKENPASPIAKTYGTIQGKKKDGTKTNPDTEAQHHNIVNSINSSSFINLRTQGMTVKSGSGELLEPGAGAKVIALNNKLEALSIKGTVTEAWKPTLYRHKAKCHYTGTCIDFDIQDGPKKLENVAQMIKEAIAQGLVPVWETKNATDFKRLKDAYGVPAQYMILFKGNHITGDHASIYDAI